MMTETGAITRSSMNNQAGCGIRERNETPDECRSLTDSANLQSKDHLDPGRGRVANRGCQIGKEGGDWIYEE